MKDNRELGVDNGWVDALAHKRLYKTGYSVGGYVDNGVTKYVLYRVYDHKHERIHEFDSQEELNNMIKLLLPPEGE